MCVASQGDMIFPIQTLRLFGGKSNSPFRINEAPFYPPQIECAAAIVAFWSTLLTDESDNQDNQDNLATLSRAAPHEMPVLPLPGPG